MTFGTPGSGREARREHRGLLVGFTVICAALAATPFAFALATGDLAQAPGADGCIAEGGDGGCAAGRELLSAKNLAVSPNGHNVYVVSSTGPSGAGRVAIFDRDPQTGALEQKPGREGCVSGAQTAVCEPGRALQGAGAVTVSRDGRSVYVASEGSSAVAVFSRDIQTGSLRQSPEPLGCVSQSGSNGGCETGRGLTAANGVLVSPDGLDVYVAGAEGSVAMFHRNLTGASERLEQRGGKEACISLGGVNNCAEARGMGGVGDIEMSPDGEYVYTVASGSDAVAVLRRNAASGLLQQPPGDAGCISNTGGSCAQGRLLDGARGLAVSSDGSQIYVLSTEQGQAQVTNALTIFDRDPLSGELHERGGAGGCITDTGNGGECGPANGFRGIANVAVSPDGESVYVTSLRSRGVAIFDRDKATGGLTQKPGTAGCVSEDPQEGCEQRRALREAKGIAISPDGHSLYVAGTSAKPAGTLAILSRMSSLFRPDTDPPKVSGFKLSPSRFRPAPKGRGSRFRFTLSERSTVKISIDRALAGRKVGKTCRAPAPKLTKRPRCTRFVHRATFAFPGQPAGAVSLLFRGRVGRRTLLPGSYRAALVATDAAGNASAPARARFTLLRPAR